MELATINGFDLLMLIIGVGIGYGLKALLDWTDA